MTTLMVKIHAVTGMKYFCKTSRDNVNNYVGSGVYWKNHLKKYGKKVHTVVIGQYQDNDPKLVSDALQFSLEHDIVNSEEWANLIMENGLDGHPVGVPASRTKKYSNEYIKSLARDFKTRTSFSNTYRSLYVIAQKRGILDWIFDHIPQVRSLSTEEIVKIASVYDNRTDFRKNHLSLYNTIKRRGELDKVLKVTSTKKKNNRTKYKQKL